MTRQHRSASLHTYAALTVSWAVVTAAAAVLDPRRAGLYSLGFLVLTVVYLFFRYPDAYSPDPRIVVTTRPLTRPAGGPREVRDAVREVVDHKLDGVIGPTVLVVDERAMFRTSSASEMDELVKAALEQHTSTKLWVVGASDAASRFLLASADRRGVAERLRLLDADTDEARDLLDRARP